MKNVHILPTDKPSRLHLGESGLVLCDFVFDKSTINAQHIYITSDEEIKDVRPHKGKWHLEKGQILNKFPNYLTDLSECKLVILTTDPDLIKDGVQEIDNEFLGWFVDNPSCESVDLDTFSMGDKVLYNVVFPKEEPKHETLEEAAEKMYPCKGELEIHFYMVRRLAFINGAKWQAERMYSEEDMCLLVAEYQEYLKRTFHPEFSQATFKQWFEQFKNK
jgi:hypothetical protein